MLTARMFSSAKNRFIFNASRSISLGLDSFFAFHDSTSPVACQSFFSFFANLFCRAAAPFVFLSSLRRTFTNLFPSLGLFGTAPGSPEPAYRRIPPAELPYRQRAPPHWDGGPQSCRMEGMGLRVQAIQNGHILPQVLLGDQHPLAGSDLAGPRHGRDHGIPSRAGRLYAAIAAGIGHARPG